VPIKYQIFQRKTNIQEVVFIARGFDDDAVLEEE
jgi:hypothetical protein